MKILINNATVVTSSGPFRKSLLIEDGIIRKVSDNPVKAKHVGFVVDNKDLLVFPGFLDMHVHLREPGHEYKGTIETGLAAAHHGGFTAVACMANTDPVNDNITITDFIKCAAKKTKYPVDVHPIAAITRGLNGEVLVEMGELREAGVVGFSDDGKPVENTGILRRAMEYAETFNMPLICHSEDKSLSGDGQVNDGKISLLLGLAGIPRESESLGIFRDITIARMTGARIHIAHVSTKEGLALIKAAKKEGVRISCETCPQYFTLTEEAVLGYNTLAKINPPLRTMEDVNAIKEGLRDGTIDVIASDHAPHHQDEKNVEFEKAPFGMIGLETTIPLTLELVRKGVIDFKDMAEKLSRRPHKILNLKPPMVREGEEAVMTIVDPHYEWKLCRETIHSKSSNTPFMGSELKGKARYIINRGNIFEV